MSANSTSPPAGRQRRSPTAGLVALALLAGILALPALGGCSGCRSDQAAEDARRAEEARHRLEEEKKQKEKPKEPFTVGKLLPQPFDDPVLKPGVKPGHWISAAQTMKANARDFEGDVRWQPVNAADQPLPLPHVRYTMGVSRPVSLSSKPDAVKQIEAPLFVLPPAEAGQDVRFAGQLVSGTLGGELQLRAEFRPMPPHEYLLLVLAREPRRYTFLKNLDSVRSPDSSAGSGATTYYDVLLPPVGNAVPLAENPLAWTALAYVVWDDLSPRRLSDGQQQAMVDWLHWGGQLIISGPESLDSLRGSFLAPYLPAESTGPVRLGAGELSALSAAWTLSTPKAPSRPLSPLKPWLAVGLRARQQVLGCAVLAATPSGSPLVVEGNVGRGRIVVTAFNLRERELSDWKSFDGFFNACLLRRGPRTYRTEGPLQDLVLDWADIPGRRLDPRRVTSLRLFGRDAGYAWQQDASSPEAAIPGRFVPGTNVSTINDPAPRPSLGAWNDFCPVANAARSTIQQAAGIEIPTASFVLWVLSGYLVVLVPLNWGFFRLIRRIEWAWIAAPLIAVASAALVVKLAQLDIGFARARTEVAVIETQPGHHRAHLTRLTALYTSLSTPYTFEFADANSLVQPFSADANEPRPGAEIGALDYRRDTQVTLTGFHVLSNRADLVRSEQMIELGGPISLEASESTSAAVANHTRYPLANAVVVRWTAAGDCEAAWLGSVDVGAVRAARFEPILPNDLLERWNQADTAALPPQRRALSLGRLLAIAANGQEARPGDVRLLASIYDVGMPGLEIRPESNQPRFATLVVANLAYGPRAAPRRDTNNRTQVDAVERAAESPTAPSPPTGTPP